MHWVVNDNLKIIVTEGAGGLSNDVYEQDRIEGNNK